VHNEKEGEEAVPEIPEIIELKGTEFSEAAAEFWDEQRARIRYQLKIIAGAKWALKQEISTRCSKEAVKAITDFEEALKAKRSFEEAFTKAQKTLEEVGEWEKCASYFALYEMVKRKRSFEKIIGFLKPKLLQLERWSEWRARMYLRHEEHEEEMLEQLRVSMGERPVWNNWLNEVQGMGLVLAAQVTGGFETALEPGETLGSHFKGASQMIAFAGLDVDPKTGKAWKRVKGEKLRYNAMLRSVLIGRVGSSFLKQNPAKSGYRRLYDQQKARLIKRFEKEGAKIVPSSKLPKNSEGKRYEPKGIISEGHLHQMALRATVKIFVHHFWEEVRRSEGLPCGLPYVIDVLGHPASSYIPPIRDTKV